MMKLWYTDSNGERKSETHESMATITTAALVLAREFGAKGFEIEIAKNA